MPYAIRLPDGTLVENIPDSVTPQQAKQRILERRPDLMGQAKPKPTDEGFLRQAADVPVNVARGAVMGVRMVADAFGANNPVSQSIKSVEGYLGGLLSAQAKNDEQEIARIMKDAEDKGILDQVKAGFQAFATAPVDLLSQGLGTAAPAIIAGLGGKVLGAGALASRAIGATTGAGMGAGAVKGQIYEGVKEALAGTGMSPEQVEARAQLAQSYGGENLDMILAGTALGGLASATGIEPILARQAARSIVGRSMAGRAAVTGLAEAVPEIAQGSQEQLAQNLALQREGFDVDTFTGVAGAGTLEGLAGAGLGAAVGALPTRQQPPVAETPALPEEVETLPEQPEVATLPPEPRLATLPPIGFTEQDIMDTGIQIPGGNLPFVRRNVLGKTREELEAFVQENPEVIENESPSSRVIRSLLGRPAGQPDQFGVEPPVPATGRAELPDTGAVVPPERAGLDVAGPVAGPAAVPAPTPTPTVTETPSGPTTPEAVEAETQEPQGPAELAGPVIEDVAVPAAPADAWNGMDQRVRLQVAQAAGLTKPANFATKNWNSLPNTVRGKLSNVLATQEASVAPPAGEGRVLSEEEVNVANQIADLEKQRRKIERGSDSLFGKLRKIGMREEDLKEVYGRRIPISAQSLRYKGRPGTSIANLVADGTLDEWLPYDKRLGATNFDPQEAEQIIIDRLGEQRYLTEDAEIEMRRLNLTIEDLEQVLKLEDINAELEIAAQEQRDLDQEAEADVASEEDRGAGRAEEAQAPAPDLELTPPTPEAQAEAERRAQEAEEKAKKEADEAEAKAQKEHERKEIEDRSKGAAEDFKLGQTAEENLTGQKDIFAEPADVQITPEAQKEVDLSMFSMRLANTAKPFRAIYASGRKSVLRPKALTAAQIQQLRVIANDAIELGMPSSLLEMVTQSGSTGMDATAGISTRDGTLLLGKGWSKITQAEKMQALIHELAHGVDKEADGETVKFSDKPKWKKAHDELQQWYDSNPIKHPLGYPFAPQFRGKVNLTSESFAQAFSFYFTSPVDLQTNAPEAYSQIQSIVEGIQNESQSTSRAGTPAVGGAAVKVQPTRAEKDSAVQPRAGEVGTGVGTAARGKDRAAERLSASKSIRENADKIAALDDDVRDNMEIKDIPGGFSAYNLYEARKMLKKPSDKLKRVTDSNSFTLWQEWDFIANVDGEYYGVSKDEDPDAGPDDEDSFIYTYARLDDPRNVISTVTSDVGELFAQIRQDEKDAGGAAEISMIQTPIADPSAVKGEGKKAIDNSRESILYQPIDGTWNTPMDPKPLKLSDEFFYNWVDKQVDLKRVVDAIKATGKRVAGKFNALERERTYHGRVAKRTQDYLTNELQPTIELMKKYGITQREIGEYLLNRHAPEANRVIAERNPKFPDAGSSVKTADAIKYMQNLEPLRKRQLDAVAKRMDKTLTKMQDMLVKYGVESQDTIDGWRDMFQHYIPLVREDADYSINKVMSQGAGYSRSGDTAKSRTGSAKEVNLDEIFSNIAMQHERMIVRAEGNRVAQSIFGLALTQPNPKFWLALDPETNVIWKTIKEVEQLKADRDLIQDMFENGDIGPSEEVEYRMELDLLRKLIKKKEQPAKAAFAKARDDLIELDFSPEQATEMVKQIMMPPMKARFNKEKNAVVYEPNAAVNNEFVFATRINGSDKFVLFNGNDERANRMARALKNMDAENLSEAMNIAAKITRFFAAINTQYNPVFGAYNFLRDLQTSALQISTTDIADKRKEVINGTPAALKAIFQVARARRDGKKLTGELTKDFEEFENEGGQTGFRDQFSQSAERAEAIQRMIDPSSWASSPLGKFFTAGGKLKVPLETMRKGAAPLFDFLSDYNQALENSVRLSAYRVARDKFIKEGMSPADAKQKAAVVAKEITVNFNQKGVKATQIGALYAFFNASVQGTTMMARTLAGPLGRKIIAGGMLWGVIQTIALALAGFDDEEPPEFVKQRNFIIPYGDGKYLAFPMPLGFNVIPTISRLATEAVVSGGENTSGKVVSLLDAVMDMFNPIGNAGMSIQTLAPTLLDPLVAIAENKSWTGQDIAREDFSPLNPTPGFTRSRDSANAISQEVARLLNYMSGGNEDRKGIISPTADQLEYLLGQFTGGVGRELLKAGKTVETAITGEELPSYSVPLVGRFYGNVNEMAAVSSAFYRNLTELNIQKEEIKTIRENKGDLQAYFAENPEARLAQMATTQYNQIKNLRKLRQEALEKGDKEKAKTLEEAIKKRMINLNERFEKLAG